MDLNGIALFNAGPNRLTLANGQTQEHFTTQQIIPEQEANYVRGFERSLLGHVLRISTPVPDVSIIEMGYSDES